MSFSISPLSQCLLSFFSATSLACLSVKQHWRYRWGQTSIFNEWPPLCRNRAVCASDDWFREGNWWHRWVQLYATGLRHSFLPQITGKVVYCQCEKLPNSVYSSARPAVDWRAIVLFVKTSKYLDNSPAETPALKILDFQLLPTTYSWSNCLYPTLILSFYRVFTPNWTLFTTTQNPYFALPSFHGS